jgi:chromosome partitioning protein
MKSIAFMSQKGGSGKTTLAVHTAVAALESGERVVIVDTDMQKSALTWREARAHDTPIVVAVAAIELDQVLRAAQGDGMSLAIVDTAPHAAPDAVRVAKAVDLVVIPCRPSAFDIAAIGHMIEIVQAAGVPGVIVLSACPFRSPEIGETRALLADYGLPAAPVVITDRRAFARAVATGRAVTEFEGDGKAAAEIRSFWTWLKGVMP